MSDIYDARRLLEDKQKEQRDIDDEYYELKKIRDYLVNYKFSYDKAKVPKFSSKKIDDLVNDSLKKVEIEFNNAEKNISYFHVEDILNNITILDDFLNEFMPLFTNQYKSDEINKNFNKSYNLINEQKNKIDKIILVEKYKIFDKVVNYFLWTHTTVLDKYIENSNTKNIKLLLQLYNQAKKLKPYNDLKNEAMLMKALDYIFKYYIEKLKSTHDFVILLDEVYNFLKDNIYLSKLSGQCLDSYNELMIILLEKFNNSCRKVFVENPNYKDAKFLFERKSIFNKNKLLIEAYKLSDIDLFSSEFYKSSMINMSEEDIKNEIENSLNDIIALSAMFQASECMGEKSANFIKVVFSIIEKKENDNTIPLLLIERLLYHYKTMNYSLIKEIVSNTITIKRLKIDKYPRVFARIIIDLNKKNLNKDAVNIRNSLLLYNKNFFNNYYLIRAAKRHKNTYLYQCYLFSLPNIDKRVKQVKEITVDEKFNNYKFTYVETQSVTRVKTINFLLVALQFLLAFAGVFLYVNNFLSIQNSVWKIICSFIIALSIPVFYILLSINCCRDSGIAKFLLVSNLIVSYLCVLFFILNKYIYTFVDLEVISDWFYVGCVYLVTLNVCQYCVTDHKISSIIFKTINSILLMIIIFLQIYLK